MHIMVIPSWYSSPENKVHGSFFKEQFQALSKAGFKITVAYNEIWPVTRIGRVKEKSGLSVSCEDGLKTYRYKGFNYLPKNPAMFRQFNRRMDKIYKEIVKNEGKVDIIHAHSAFWGGIAGEYISRKYNIPFVLTEHSSMKYAKHVRESYKKYVISTYNNADCLIAVGSGLKKELEGYTSNKILISHNIVDTGLFAENYSEEKNTDDINKKDDEKFILFSCAFLVEEKGMELLTEAFAEVFKNKNAELRIGGDGPLRPVLEKIIKEKGVENQVKLLGALSRKEVADEVHKCSAFALISEHETFGVVYIEAMAGGKPVIGTYNGGAEDIINENNGLIIEKNNKEKLKEALIKMKNEYKKFDSDFIKQETKKKYGAARLVEEMKEVYKKLYER